MNLPNNNVWQNRLTRNMNGEALCTMPNIALILKSDPNLKNIVFNEMKKTLDIIGAVPWKTEASGWDTTDFPCLQMYLEDNYHIYAPRNNYPQWGKRLFRDKDSLMRYLSES